MPEWLLFLLAARKALPYTDSFKYLGMVCDKQINLNTAADATLCPFTAGTFKVTELVQKHNLCHVESWYQLKQGLQVRAISVRQALPLRCVEHLLPLHTRRKWRLKQRTEEMVLRQVWEKSELLLQEDHLNWPNNPTNRKTVAHIINPRENNLNRPCHWLSMTPSWQATHVHMASQDKRYSCWYACESDLGHSLLTRQRDGRSP